MFIISNSNKPHDGSGKSHGRNDGYHNPSFELKEKRHEKTFDGKLEIGRQVAVFVGLAAIGSGNASPLPDEENRACTNATLHGTYQWSITGYIQATTQNGGNIGDFAPIVEASYAVFNGHGTIMKLVSTDNFSSGGSFTVTGTGTYIVNPDCSGTFNTSVGTINRHLEILDGETVDFVHTDAGLIIAGTMKKLENRNTE